MVANNYADGAVATTLTASYDSDTNATLSVASVSGFPAVPFYLTIERGTTSQQVVKITDTAGLTLTATHVSGSTITHVSGKPVVHSVPAIHFDTTEDHLEATSTHGLADTGWVTTGFVAATNYGVVAARYRIKNGVCYVQVEIQRTGSTKSVGSNGNFGNEDIVTIPLAARPPIDIPFGFVADTTNGGGILYTEGNVRITSGNPNADISSLDTLEINTSYPIN